MKRSLVRDIQQTQLAMFLVGCLALTIVLFTLLWGYTITEQKRVLIALSELIKSEISKDHLGLEYWSNPINAQTWGDHLTPEIARVVDVFPAEFVGGFYSLALDQVVACYGHDLPLEHNVHPDKSGRFGWDQRSPWVSLEYSANRHTLVLKCDNPVRIDGSVVGYAIANLPLAHVLAAFRRTAWVIVLATLSCLLFIWLISRKPICHIVQNIRDLKLVQCGGKPEFDYCEFEEIAQANYQAYQEISRAERQKTQLLRYCPWGYLIVDSHGVCVKINQQGAASLGRDRNEIVGKRLSAKEFPITNKVLSQGLPMEGESVGKRGVGTGGTAVLYCSAFPIQLDSGEMGVMTWFVDITRLKALEAKVHHMDRLSTVGEMTSIITHDIRNPLASIKCLAQLGELTPEKSEQLSIYQRINATVNDINQYLERILSFSQPNREDSQEKCQVRYMFENVELMLKSKFTGTGIGLEFEVSEPEPYVFVNQLNFQYVLFNLVNNAFEVMTQAGLTGTVTLKAKMDGTVTIIEVSDQGPGIAPANLPRIWDMFFTTKPLGNGIGLAMVKKVVEQHHGTIQVTTLPEGTTFAISLPTECAGELPA